jgi:hypothetical protein
MVRYKIQGPQNTAYHYYHYIPRCVSSGQIRLDSLTRSQSFRVICYAYITPSMDKAQIGFNIIGIFLACLKPRLRVLI